MAFAGPPGDDGRSRTKRVALTRIIIDATFVAGGVALLGPANAVHTGALSPGTLLLAAGTGPLIAHLSKCSLVFPASRPSPCGLRHATEPIVASAPNTPNTDGNRACTNPRQSSSQTGKPPHTYRRRS